MLKTVAIIDYIKAMKQQICCEILIVRICI